MRSLPPTGRAGQQRRGDLRWAESNRAEELEGCMTEQEWRDRDNPKQLLEYLGKQPGVSARKLLLFAAACCRRIWPLLTHAGSRQAVELLESWLDGSGD